MTFEEVYERSSRAQKKLLESRFFQAAYRVSLYASFRNEVLTDDVFQKAIEEGKEVYYPRVTSGSDGRLGFFKVRDLKELSPGRYEIPEPGSAEDRIDPLTFDLVVVPGVAFDLRGARLGYGKGYYDRVLGQFKCRIVGLAFDFQVLNETIPIETHDVKVTAIVTEKRVIRV